MIVIDLFKKIRIYIYNQQHNTNIHSLKASLHAKYDKKVTISENVVVSPTVSIGKYSYVNRNSSIENCTIGNYCSISSGVWVCPYEHRLDLFSTHPFLLCNFKEKREKVSIGNDVLISLNAIILSGVRVGDGAVIAAGSVVTHDVEPFEIVGGVPAKHIKWRFPKEMQDAIIKSEWWKRDPNEIDKDNIINCLIE